MQYSVLYLHYDERRDILPANVTCPYSVQMSMAITKATTWSTVQSCMVVSSPGGGEKAGTGGEAGEGDLLLRLLLCSSVTASVLTFFSVRSRASPWVVYQSEIYSRRAISM